MAYKKSLTAKKSVFGLVLGLVAAGIPVALEVLQGFPAEAKIGGIVTVGILVGALTGVLNWAKHKND